MQTLSAPSALYSVGLHGAGSAGEHLFGDPPVADLLTLVGRPCEAAVAPTVVAIPEQVAVIHDGVNDTLHSGEHLYLVPSFSVFLPLHRRPCEPAGAPTLKEKPAPHASSHNHGHNPHN